jgi:CheY-like chemotaxis protein
MPGSQIKNRLQDLNYRVLTVDNAAQLMETVQREMPLLLVADLQARSDICGTIQIIRQTPATSHLPVIAFAPDNSDALFQTAQKAGANMAVGETVIASHLPQLLEQALHLD